MKHIRLWHTTAIEQSPVSTQWDEAALTSLQNDGFFTLKTCQRIIFVKRVNSEGTKFDEALQGFDQLIGPAAYQFILETICGLKSRLLGETEIVSQFKESFENYLKSEQRDARLIKVFHKIFMDAKKIRSEHLQKIGLLSYCGLTKNLLNKHYQNHSLDQEKNDVVILGSGKLAADLLKVLNKNYEISLHARNREVVEHYANKYAINAIDRVDHNDLFHKKIIINTIGTDTTLFYDDFFKQWKGQHFCRQRNIDPSLFIDLSSPSVIDTSYSKLEAVYRLDDLFKLAQKMHEEKDAKLKNALQAISKITAKRQAHFSPSNFSSWEGYQLA